MKSSKKRTEKTFVPFTLSIEVESEEEEELLNMFGRLVETMSLKDLLGNNLCVPSYLHLQGILRDTDERKLLTQIMHKAWKTLEEPD